MSRPDSFWTKPRGSTGGCLAAFVIICALLAFGVAAIVATQSSETKSPPVRLSSPSQHVSATFGAPFRSVGAQLLDFQKCPGSSELAQWSFGLDLAKTVIAITRNACAPETLTPQEAEREVAQFLPSDAQFVRDFQTADGWPAREYRSQALARRYPADHFRSCDGTLSPGAISSTRSPAGSMWLLALGTCL